MSDVYRTTSEKSDRNRQFSVRLIWCERPTGSFKRKYSCIQNRGLYVSKYAKKFGEWMHARTQNKRRTKIKYRRRIIQDLVIEIIGCHNVSRFWQDLSRRFIASYQILKSSCLCKIFIQSCLSNTRFQSLAYKMFY